MKDRKDASGKSLLVDHVAGTDPRVSRRDLIRWASVLGVGGIGAGLISCSDPPEQDVSSGVTQPTTVQAGSTVNGVVTGLFNGVGVRNAEVEVVGAGTVRADFSGAFTIHVELPGDYTLIVSENDFVTRRSALRLTGNTTFAMTLMEDDEGPGATFLNQFARGTGPTSGPPPRTPGQTNRWAYTPRVLIYRRVVGDPSTVVPGVQIDRIISVVNSTFGQFTAGALGFSPMIEQVDSVPPADPTQTPIGAIGFSQTSDGSRGGGTTGAVSDPFEAASGYAFTALDAPVALLNRVFGQSLGATIVDSSMTSVMNPSGQSSFSEKDAQASKVLYNRPAGSRSPDVDPERYFINL
jgi:hypothetical protein